MSEVTVWLQRWRDGDSGALDALMPLVYDELRQAARRQLHREGQPHTLGATALVHEMYMRLLGQRRIVAEDRTSFLAIAATIMRRVLVDYARRRRRLKRGGAGQPVSLDESEEPALLSDVQIEEVLGVDAALERLRTIDARAADVVDCRFFGGLTTEETADALGLSVRTVTRTWTFARAWLRQEVGGAQNLGPDL